MSKVLKRPMFRGGGAVNAQGTGIMSGLEPRVELCKAGGFTYLKYIKTKKNSRYFKNRF
jgi:hypothetical protein